MSGYSLRRRGERGSSTERPAQKRAERPKRAVRDKMTETGGREGGSSSSPAQKRRKGRVAAMDPVSRISLSVQSLAASLPEHREEFTLPSSWMEPTPIPPYRLLAKNRYSQSIRPGVLFPYEPAPPCACRRESGGCDDKCHNFQLLMECTPESCPCCGSNKLTSRKRQLNQTEIPESEWCGNTVIQRASFPQIEVFESAFCGFGLRCPNNLPAFTIVAEYTGEVITEEECMKRMSKYKKTDAFYFASLGKGLILDASKMGSIARFANHSCAPNCALQKWCVNGEPRVVLITLDEALPPGTELCYNYQYCQDGLELNDSQRQPCHCGALCCAGTIGGKVATAPPSFVDKWLEKAKKVLKTISVTSPASNCEVNSPPPSHQLQIYQSRISLSEDSLYGSVNTRRVTVPYIIDLLNFLQDDDLEEENEPLFRAAEKETIVRSDEFKTLCAVLRDIESWQQKFPNNDFAPSLSSFPAKIVLCSREHLRQMSTDFPFNGVKLQISDWVEKSIKAADIADTSIKKVLDVQICLENHHQAPNPPNFISQAMLSDGQVSRADTNWRFDWDDFIIIIEKMKQALPIICAQGSDILKSYQTCSEWARDYLYVYLNPVNLADFDIKRKRSSNFHMEGAIPNALDLHILNLPSHYAALWKTIFLLGQAYDIDLSAHFVVVASNIEDRITLYENRLHLKDERIKQSEGHPCAGERNIHCFCQMTEEDAEYSEFVMCDHCSQWYHLECCNIFLKKDSKQYIYRSDDSAFHCPLCQMDLGELSQSYSTHAAQEWQCHCISAFRPKPKPKKVKDKIKLLENENVIRRKENVGNPPYVFKDSTEESNSSLKKANCNTIVVPVFGAVTLDYFEKVVASENWGSPIYNTPVTGNIKAVLDNANEWVQHIESTLMSNYCVQDTRESVKNEERLIDTILNMLSVLSKYREKQRDLLELYVDLRLLCVCPLEIFTLRRLIWASAVQIFFSFKEVKKESVSSNIRCHCHVQTARKKLGLPSISEKRFISLVALKKLCYNGKIVSKSDGPTSLQVLDSTVRTLHYAIDKLFSDVVDILREALSCRDPGRASCLLDNLNSLTHGNHFSIDITGEYAYARLMSLLKSLPLDERCNSSTLIEGVGTHDNIVDPETYCWCNRPEQGQMICCERCDIWFHCNCVGLFSKKIIKSLSNQSYTCISCTEKIESTCYPFSWSSKFIV